MRGVNHICKGLGRSILIWIGAKNGKSMLFCLLMPWSLIALWYIIKKNKEIKEKFKYIKYKYKI